MRPFYRNLLLAFMTLATLPATAQIQQAWVVRYNNGITNGTNQAVKMALDSSGNIYVTGFSQNASAQLGYVTIRYTLNGNQVWASRYDSADYPTASPSAIILDNSNDVFVTGSAWTIKYASNGNQLWTAPYAGTALTADSNANVYVAGFSQDFGTVKIAPLGTNIWLTTYVDPYGPTISQSVLVDSANNVYVSGLDSYMKFTNNGVSYGPYVTLTTIKYGSNGNQLWKTSAAPTAQNASLQVEGSALDCSNNLYLVAHFNPWLLGLVAYKYASTGNLVWTAYNPDGAGTDIVYDLMLDNTGSMLLTGQFGYFGPNYSYGTYAYGTYKANVNGSWLWTNFFPIGPFSPSAALGITVDSANNCYVTGYSPGTNSGNDIVTIAYGPNGNQLWLQRYHGPGNGNCAGNAIAVDHNGNVYVTGYDTAAAGGTEIVTIKYSPVIIKKQANGSILLEAQGSPGESFDIQASTNLQSWQDLGSAITDTNGLMQFDDTNAPNYPARFYVTFPQ